MTSRNGKKPDPPSRKASSSAEPRAPAKRKSRPRRKRKAPRPGDSPRPEEGARGAGNAPGRSRAAAPRESLAELVEAPPSVPPPASDREPPLRYADEENELADVEAQIRALEARLHGMLRQSERPRPGSEPPSIRDTVTLAAREVVDRLSPPLERPGADGTVVDSVRDLFSSDYYLRQWGRLGMRNRSEQVDDFGLDPVYERRIRPIAEFLYKRYFRVEVEGVEHIPSEGKCLVVANHSGTLPLDGLMLRTCVRLEHPAGRELRWLAEDFLYYLPFAGAFMSRVGAVRACQENAERLLKNESLVAVFPEGVKGIGKLYRDRYRLQRFGRGGFIRLCLRTGTPLIPCAVIGAEESNPMLYREEFVSKAFGLPYLPITPTFPLLGPAGLVPAPTKWRIFFGPRLDFGGLGPEAAQDEVLVGRLSERIRGAIQHMLDQALKERRSVWLG